jgi:hypothetical protein
MTIREGDPHEHNNFFNSALDLARRPPTGGRKSQPQVDRDKAGARAAG